MFSLSNDGKYIQGKTASLTSQNRTTFVKEVMRL